MKIWVDADACPRPVKDILYRAAERKRIELTLVANMPLSVPRSPWIASRTVEAGLDAGVEVLDVVHHVLRTGSLDDSCQAGHHDAQPGLLLDLADDRGPGALSGLDAASRERPSAAAGLPAAAHQQQPLAVIAHHGTHGGNACPGHEVTLRPPTSVRRPLGGSCMRR